MITDSSPRPPHQPASGPDLLGRRLRAVCAVDRQVAALSRFLLLPVGQPAHEPGGKDGDRRRGQGEPVIDDTGLVPAGVPTIRLYFAQTLARWFRCWQHESRAVIAYLGSGLALLCV